VLGFRIVEGVVDGIILTRLLLLLFFDMSTEGKGEGGFDLVTRFIRHGPQPIGLPLGDLTMVTI
jgi:hypothetical protein